MTLQTEKLGYWYQTESEALFREVDLTFDSGKCTRSLVPAVLVKRPFSH